MYIPIKCVVLLPITPLSFYILSLPPPLSLFYFLIFSLCINFVYYLFLSLLSVFPPFYIVLASFVRVSSSQSLTHLEW